MRRSVIRLFATLAVLAIAAWGLSAPAAAGTSCSRKRPCVPGTPTLTATAATGAAKLTWTTPSDGGSTITGYNIYRGTAAGNATLLLSVPASTAYTDTAVTAGVRYYYQVSAVNKVGAGSRSNEVSAVPAATSTTSALTAPTGLSATVVSASQVNLSWSAASGAASYVVYRDATLVTTVASSLTSHSDTGLPPSTSYTYSVYAKDSAGNLSASSNRVTVTTAAEVNLAAGRLATSGASWQSNVAYATDGSLTTGYATISSGPQWVKIDLGTSAQVRRVKLWHYFADGRIYRDVVVQLSNAADFSSGVSTIFNNDGDNSAGQGVGRDAEYVESKVAKEIQLPAAVSARYVRLWSNGSNVNASNHYVEVEVYETPAQPACTSDRTTWTAVGSTPLTDAAAAALVCRKPETRPENATQNNYVPTDAELEFYRNGETDAYGRTALKYNPKVINVTGRHGLTNPSTDDLIQWASHKWGIPTDWVRAQMVTETSWRMSGMGDRKTVIDPLRYPAHTRIAGTSDVYQSLGISQIKWNHPDSNNSGVGSEPLRWKSTAFNLDFYGAMLRYYYDGQCYWCTTGYAAGQQWESVGAWYNPSPWNGTTAQSYVTTVQKHLTERTWERF